MKYPEGRDCERNTPQGYVQQLKDFRSQLKSMAQMMEDCFGDRPETKDVIRNLIQARMWSGNLFGYYDVEDLNRKRDTDK